MIKIDHLKNHPHAVPRLANIWHETIGKIWLPEISIEEIEALSYEELKSDMPITYIALYDDIPVGFCTLELDGGVRQDLGPWIGDLVVDPNYQKQGIGKKLLDAMTLKAKELELKNLYLFTFEPSISEYYARFGWKKFDMAEFKGHPVTLMEVEL